MSPLPSGRKAAGGRGAAGRGGFAASLRARSRALRSALPLVPFIAFSLLFLILPAALILIGSFQDSSGSFTLANFRRLAQPNIVESYRVTIQLSAASAALGTAFGFFLAYAVAAGGLPASFKSFLLSFSGVASNFAGVPLAFAFISTLGRMGMVTAFLRGVLGLDLYESGFSLYGFWGLCLTYLYFQIPLMVLVISPAIEALRREWREAAQSLGASRLRFWIEVALPILSPSLISAALLLFGNTFGAYATAYALTGGMLNLVTILIGAQIRGDVLHDPNLGYALAFGMVVVMTLSTALAGVFRRRASRWLA
jgi:putative spermidine/putrescine transport system permease protein